MIKTIKIDTLDQKSISKAYATIAKVEYNLNFKKVSKLTLTDLNVAGAKILSAKHGINTIGDVSKLTLIELKKLRGVGPKAAIAVQEVMLLNGINFKVEKKVINRKGK